MNYLVVENHRAKIVSAKKLRAWINHATDNIRIFRLCGTNDPVELFIRWFGIGNDYIIVDKYGNIEGGI